MLMCRDIKELHRQAAEDLGVDEEVKAELEQLLSELQQLLVGVSIMQDLTLRAKDSLVSFGERLSTRLFAAFLTKEVRESLFRCCLEMTSCCKLALSLSVSMLGCLMILVRLSLVSHCMQSAQKRCMSSVPILYCLCTECHAYVVCRVLPLGSMTPGIWVWSHLMTSPMLMCAMSSPSATSGRHSPAPMGDPRRSP